MIAYPVAGLVSGEAAGQEDIPAPGSVKRWPGRGRVATVVAAKEGSTGQ